MNSITRNMLIRIVARVVNILKEHQDSFQEIHPFEVEGEAGWRVAVEYMDRGVYKFRTYDPHMLETQACTDYWVRGDFVYKEPGDLSAELGGPLYATRYNISTDFPYMIEIMTLLLETFEAMMEIPIRHADGDIDDDDEDDVEELL